MLVNEMRIFFFRNLNTDSWLEKKWNYEFKLYAYIWIIRTMCRVIPSTWLCNFDHTVHCKKYKKKKIGKKKLRLWIVLKNYERFPVIWLKSILGLYRINNFLQNCESLAIFYKLCVAFIFKAFIFEAFILMLYI